jgi:hypothetical protein
MGGRVVWPGSKDGWLFAEGSMMDVTKSDGSWKVNGWNQELGMVAVHSGWDSRKTGRSVGEKWVRSSVV